LAEKASRLTPPQNPPLKDQTFKLVGKPTRRLDTPDKTEQWQRFWAGCECAGDARRRRRSSAGLWRKTQSFKAEKAKAIPVQRG
jgi:isoquinoline 1-oxidoreductase beta subunit